VLAFTQHNVLYVTRKIRIGSVRRGTLQFLITYWIDRRAPISWRILQMPPFVEIRDTGGAGGVANVLTLTKWHDPSGEALRHD
jgi:hypothetical protein